MIQPLDLKALERKAYRSYHKDGFLEIALGLFLLISVLSSTLSESGVPDRIRQLIYIPLIIMVPVGLALAKKFITVPRMGYVKFGPMRTKQRKHMIGVIIVQMILVIGLLYITVGVSAGRWDWPQPRFVMPLLISLGILVGIGLIAYFADLPRLYLGAFLLAIPEPIYSALDYHTDLSYIGVWAFGPSSLILLGLGVAGLRQFLTKYPLQAGEVPNEC